MHRDFHIVGHLYTYHPDNDVDDQIYETDFNTDDPDRKLLLTEWAGGLANPWSGSAESYILNCDDRQEVDEDHRWSATYCSIFYDCLESTAVCYAKTPNEALQKVQNLVKMAIEKYAPKDDEDDEIVYFGA